MSHAHAKADVAGTAKLLVVLMAFAWGLNWVAAVVVLREVPPWSMRFAGSGIGAATLFAVAILTGHNLRVPRREYVHVMVAGFFNVAAFQILSAFAQLNGATSRAVVITYSMPIWAKNPPGPSTLRALKERTFLPWWSLPVMSHSSLSNQLQ